MGVYQVQVDPSTQEVSLFTLASGVRIWIGTTEARDIAIANDEIPAQTVIITTDDGEDYITVDDSLSTTSTNPVQNKVLTEILNPLIEANILVAQPTQP